MVSTTVTPIRQLHWLEPSGVPSLAGTWLDNNGRKGNGVNNLTDYLNSNDNQFIRHYGNNVNRFHFRCNEHNIWPTGLELTVRCSSAYSGGAEAQFIHFGCNGRTLIEDGTGTIDTSGIQNITFVSPIDNADREYILQNHLNKQYSHYTFYHYINGIENANEVFEAPSLQADGFRLYNLNIKWLGESMDNSISNPLNEVRILEPVDIHFNNEWVNESGTNYIHVNKLSGTIEKESDGDQRYIRQVACPELYSSGNTTLFPDRFFDTFYLTPSGGNIKLVFDANELFTKVDLARLKIRMTSEPTGAGVITSDSFQRVSLGSTDIYNGGSSLAWNGSSFAVNGYLFRNSASNPLGCVLNTSLNDNVRIISDVYIPNTSNEFGVTALNALGGTNISEAYMLIASGTEIKLVARSSDANTMIANTFANAGELHGSVCRFLLEVENSGIYGTVSTPSGNIYSLSAFDNSISRGTYAGLYTNYSSSDGKFFNVRINEPTHRNDENDAFVVHGYYHDNNNRVFMFGCGDEISSSGFKTYTVDLSWFEQSRAFNTMTTPDMYMHSDNNYMSTNLNSANDFAPGIELFLTGLPSGTLISSANLELYVRNDEYLPLWVGAGGKYCFEEGTSNFTRNKTNTLHGQHDHVSKGSGIYQHFNVGFYQLREIGDNVNDGSIVYSDFHSNGSRRESGVYYQRVHSGTTSVNSFVVTKVAPSGYTKHKRPEGSRGVFPNGQGHSAWRYTVHQNLDNITSTNNNWPTTNTAVKNYHYNTRKYYQFDLNDTNWNMTKTGGGTNEEQQYSVLILFTPSGDKAILDNSNAINQRGAIIASMVDKNYNFATHTYAGADPAWQLFLRQNDAGYYFCRLEIDDRYGTTYNIDSPYLPGDYFESNQPVGALVIIDGTNGMDGGLNTVGVGLMQTANNGRVQIISEDLELSENEHGIQNKNKLVVGAGHSPIEWHQNGGTSDAIYNRAANILLHEVAISATGSFTENTRFWQNRVTFMPSGFSSLNLPIVSGNSNSNKYLSWEVPQGATKLATTTSNHFYTNDVNDRFVQITLPNFHAFNNLPGFPSGIKVKALIENDTNNPSGLHLTCGINIKDLVEPVLPPNNQDGDIWGKIVIPSSQMSVYEFSLSNLVPFNELLSAPSGSARELVLKTEYPGLATGSYYGRLKIYSLEIFLDGWCVPGTGNKSVDLYTKGKEPESSNNFDMMLLNTTEPKDVDLFLHGHEQITNTSPFYTLAGSIHSANPVFYLHGIDTKNNTISFWTGSSEKASGDFVSLYIDAVYSQNTNVRFITEGRQEPISSGNTPFFAWGTSNSGVRKVANFSIPMNSGDFDSANMVPMYMKVENGSDTEEIPFFIGSSPVKKFSETTFVVFNNSSGNNNNFPMFVGTPTGADGELSVGDNIYLFIARDNEGVKHQFNMHILGPSGINNNLNMIIKGVTDVSNSSITMYMSPGEEPPKTGNVRLYTHGF